MIKNRFIIITGLSGAGKSLAMHFFEDMNYFCIDNLLPALLPNFAQICLRSNINKAALVIDIRGRKFFKDLFSALKALSKLNFQYKILFLEARDAVLVRRFSETRRRHPLFIKGRVALGIVEERKQLKKIRNISHHIIDTTKMSPQDLKKKIISIYFPEKDVKTLDIIVVTFGFKYGTPLDADLIFDVRFIPNPFYNKNLQNLSGKNKKVKNHVMKWSQTHQFLKKMYSLHKFLIPHYIKEGKSNLTIAIGCTGGRHRAVVIGEALTKFFKKLKYSVALEHRDLMKG